MKMSLKAKHTIFVLAIVVAAFITNGVGAQEIPKESHLKCPFPIGFLVTHDKLVSIKSGSEGPTYTVQAVNGTIMAVNLTERELIARYPQLEATLKTGIAINDARLFDHPVQSDYWE